MGTHSGCAAPDRGPGVRLRMSIYRINPEPWTSPEVGIGRRNGRPFPIVHKSAQLRTYQDAIADVVGASLPEHFQPFSSEIVLHFYLWRRLETYVSASGRNVTKHRVDATNCQKALEDALQGVVFTNDRLVRRISTVMVAQGTSVEPRIDVECWPWEDIDAGGAIWEGGKSHRDRKTVNLHHVSIELENS